MRENGWEETKRTSWKNYRWNVETNKKTRRSPMKAKGSTPNRSPIKDFQTSKTK
uniref:Uncharacterized protein n=1 Tax=Rhizophora mucronata TaxID=61149 RepID=A0A2P2PRL8_RHIMU